MKFQPRSFSRAWFSLSCQSMALGALACLMVLPAMELSAAEAEADEAASSVERALPPPETLFAGQLLAPKAFRAAVDNVLPSLVTIETFGGLSGASRKGKMQGISRPGDGPTSGVILSADGYVITSTFNFLRKPPVITVVRQDGTRHVAKLLGRDETRKLCLLKIDDVDDLPVPEFASPEQIKIGAWAISVGVGYGDDEPLISAGIISALNRVSGRAVQTDANISPANYGGPLLDIEGRVIGICVPLNPTNKAVAAGVEWYDSGIGFAVPLHNMDKIIADMKAGKTIQHGSMGVQVKPASAKGDGAVIAKVLEKSGAEKAGLKAEDQILAVAGDAVLDVTQLRVLIGRYVVGDEVSFTIQRGDEKMDVLLTLQVPPPPQPQPVIKRRADGKQPQKKPAEKPAEKPADKE